MLCLFAAQIPSNEPMHSPSSSSSADISISSSSSSGAGVDTLHSEGQYVGPDLEEQIYSNSTNVELSVDVASAQDEQSEDHRAHNKRKLSACKGSSDTIPLKMRKLEVICNNIKEQPSEVLLELTRLRAENERLHQEIMESSETQQENQILRNEIEYLKQKLKEMYTRTENTKSNSVEELLKENENLKKEINVLYMNLGNFATAVQSTKDILAKNNDSISVMQQKFDEERKNFESFEAYKQVYTTCTHSLSLPFSRVVHLGLIYANTSLWVNASFN